MIFEKPLLHQTWWQCHLRTSQPRMRQRVFPTTHSLLGKTNRGYAGPPILDSEERPRNNGAAFAATSTKNPTPDGPSKRPRLQRGRNAQKKTVINELDSLTPALTGKQKEDQILSKAKALLNVDVLQLNLEQLRNFVIQSVETEVELDKLKENKSDIEKQMRVLFEKELVEASGVLSEYEQKTQDLSLSVPRTVQALQRQKIHDVRIQLLKLEGKKRKMNGEVLRPAPSPPPDEKMHYPASYSSNVMRMSALPPVRPAHENITPVLGSTALALAGIPDLSKPPPQIMTTSAVSTNPWGLSPVSKQSSGFSPIIRNSQFNTKMPAFGPPLAAPQFSSRLAQSLNSSSSSNFNPYAHINSRYIS